MISIKIHKSYRNVVAVCDLDLIGKKFEEGECQLDVKENFFKGDEITTDKAIEIMKEYEKEDSTFNIVGDESINSALKAKIISEEGIKRINNVPFALVLM